MNPDLETTCASTAAEKQIAVLPVKFSFTEFPRNTNRYASLPNRCSGSYHTDEDDGDVSRTTPVKNSTEKTKRQLTKRQGQNSSASTASEDSFGLSKNLSSESLRNACEFYDDEISDDDLIVVQNTPQSFHNKANTKKFNNNTFFTMENRRMPKNVAVEEEEDPLWSLSCSSTTTSDIVDAKSNGIENPYNDDALDVLNELDAILDIHGASQLNSSYLSGGTLDDKVEDCLMELDNYLEELDNDNIAGSVTNLKNTTHDEYQRSMNRRQQQLPARQRRLSQSEIELNSLGEFVASSNVNDFERGHQLRKTISCALETRPTRADPLESNSDDIWQRRNSMRHTEPILNFVNDDTAAQHAKDTLKHNAAFVQLPLTDDSIMNSSTLPAPLDIEMRRCFSQSDCTTAATSRHPQIVPNEILTEENIFHNLLHNESLQASDEIRPRQFGRRAEGHPRFQAVHSDLVSPNCSVLNHQQHERRPMSAPAHTAGPNFNQQQQRSAEFSLNQQQQHIDNTLYTASDLSSTHSSRIPSPLSVASSSSDTSSSTAASTTENLESNIEINDNQQAQQQSGISAAQADTGIPPLSAGKCGFNSAWPHSGSRTLALLGCTLGVFNLCRFAMLTINYGGNFLLQFLLLSFVFGIPLLWLQMCLGAKIKAGPVSMWKISPICSGVGIALVLVQFFIAIYSTVSIAWILIYFRDIFPNKGHSVYRWQETAFPYRYSPDPTNANLTSNIADYFNIIVLQRLQFAKRPDGTGVRFHVNDRLAFYLALIWAAVFLILCKGLKSFGKIIFLLGTLPLMTLIVVTGKFVYVIDPTKLLNIFSSNDFDDFLINSKTWTAATQETFLTWGLLGASVIAMTSRSHLGVSKRTLRRDAIFLVFFTLFGLSVAALLGLCCLQILKQNDYIYVPASFEQPDSYTSVYSLKAPINPELLSFPPKWVPHYSSFVGETYRRPTAIIQRESGYQALRFISEFYPAALALTNESISWIWAAVSFIMFALFGLAQLCCMWKPISSALGNSTSSVLLSCVTGLLLSIPFATEMGISILYYFDFLLGGAWFLPILWTAQIFGVFLIRGRPYNGDDLVNDLKMSSSMSAFLALSWNVLLPIGLVTLSIIDYKTSLSNQFYYWRGKTYFSYWSRKVGSLIQLGFLLLVPITAIIQIYRYLSKGPTDILDRIQLLYRPMEETSELNRINRNNLERRQNENNNGTNNNDTDNLQIHNDAPPKYTPPPSYTTATGARLAKILRQSIRRSVRRVLGATERTRPAITTADAESNQQNYPPDYLTILTNPTGSSDVSNQSTSETIEIDQRPIRNPYGHRSLSLGRKITNKNQRLDELTSTQQRPSSATPTLELHPHLQRPYTAEDVITILRSSVRNRPGRGVTLPRGLNTMTSHSNNNAYFRSIENLVLNAEPPDQTPGVGTLSNNDAIGDEQAQNNTSVI